jgi:hypothetical protein
MDKLDFYLVVYCFLLFPAKWGAWKKSFTL